MLQMLTLNAPAFGLDVSDLSLKIVQLKRHGRFRKAVSFGEFRIPQGVISQGEIKKKDELVSIVRESVRAVQGQSLLTNRVVVSLPEERVFLQMLQLPPMHAEEIKTAVRFQAEKYIPYSLENVYLDHQVAEPFVDNLNHRDVLVSSIPRQVADAYLEVFLEAGLTPVAFEAESLAICRALIPQEASPVPLLLLDMGETRTGLVVFAGKSPVFTSSIPISSFQMTEAIAKDMGVDFKTAEALKLRYGITGTEGESSKIASSIIPLLSEIIKHAKRYVGYYSSHATHQHLAQDRKTLQKIVLSGGGSLLKGLVKFLSEELGMSVELGNPWVNVSAQPPSNLPPLSLQESVRYATAIGLAMRAVP